MILILYRLYVTYRKQNPITGKVYVGMANGLVNNISANEANKIVSRRDSSHHMTKKGFLPAELDEYSENGDAIRGHEDALIRENKDLGISGNKNNGISVRNKKRKQYLEAALRVFGDAVITSIAVLVWNNLF